MRSVGTPADLIAPGETMNAVVEEATTRTEDRPAVAAPAEDPAAVALPVWFFAFEGVLSAAFDLIKAVPSVWPALVALLVVNIAVSLTMMRKRLKLARALWRGRGTRRIALGLLALRIGSHVVLAAAGVALTGMAAHLAFAVVLAATTVTLLAYSQRTALRALAAQRA
ncbi:hypothetical protein AB0D08_29920 [Kitasatospora sp. NPDC048540]|uniref:hypothetical protein n=1 Tax=Kitasatospora sp. NPDC048540 TaxID=3155634 RepID=UPI003404F38F